MRLTVTLIALCLQYNQTPLDLAVEYRHSEVVYYFVQDLKMDITQFDQVQYSYITFTHYSVIMLVGINFDLQTIDGN